MLPLAGSTTTVLWRWRQGSHTELAVLAKALGAQVDIHDVEGTVFMTQEGLMGSKLNIKLLSFGAHIEVVFE